MNTTNIRPLLSLTTALFFIAACSEGEDSGTGFTSGSTTAPAPTSITLPQTTGSMEGSAEGSQGTPTTSGGETSDDDTSDLCLTDPTVGLRCHQETEGASTESDSASGSSEESSTGWEDHLGQTARLTITAHYMVWNNDGEGLGKAEGSWEIFATTNWSPATYCYFDQQLSIVKLSTGYMKYLETQCIYEFPLEQGAANGLWLGFWVKENAGLGDEEKYIEAFKNLHYDDDSLQWLPWEPGEFSVQGVLENLDVETYFHYSVEYL